MAMPDLQLTRWATYPSSVRGSPQQATCLGRAVPLCCSLYSYRPVLRLPLCCFGRLGPGARHSQLINPPSPDRAAALLSDRRRAAARGPYLIWALNVVQHTVENPTSARQ